MENFYRKFLDYRIGFYSLLLILFLGSYEESLAQKNDYIVFGDTVKSDGYIQNVSDQINTHIYFKVRRNDEFVKYSIVEVTEFFVNQKKFFTKEILLEGKKNRVFLQLISHDYPGVNLYKLIGERDIFFLEDNSGLRQLSENYKEELSSLFENEFVERLIDITYYNEFSLSYLFNTAKSIKEPRTFTKVFSASPYLGYSLTQNSFISSKINSEQKVSGSAPIIGVNLEATANPMRSLSLIFSPSWSKANAQELIASSNNNFTYETDYYLEYSIFQFPILLRYYYDLKPNSWRPYVELGYAYSIFQYYDTGMFQAEISGNTVNTYRGEIELKDKYRGLTGGIGIEKYLKKSKALVAGLRTSILNEESGEKFTSTSIFFGFKF